MLLRPVVDYGMIVHLSGFSSRSNTAYRRGARHVGLGDTIFIEIVSWRNQFQG